MARPKAFSDEKIFRGVLTALSEVGYAKLTLSTIAKRIGVSPAALIQRFQTKNDLFVAFFDDLNTVSEQAIQEAKQLPSGLEGIRALAYLWITADGDPIHCANIASFYTDCISEPELREKAKQRLIMVDQGIQELLYKAVQTGELTSCPVPQLSRVLQSAVTGALLMWATNGEDPPEDWINDCMDVVLGPYLVEGRSPS
ncbi:TetR/AcrR family transcriptional regulator [Paenibacillus daejeonensis]|uniref:TetR/AcrR family transcriptional regulator n=1 Tax=Paenibacillus daejeonensis TaxID=135193 RepID=UPI00037BD2FA|nr:TetR/AcrR family transcriptional regulator [Paenibacillus daejeonensis]